MSIDNKIAVIASNNLIFNKANELANRLNLPLIMQNQEVLATNSYKFLLTVTPERLELQENTAKKTKPIAVDFLAPQINYRTKYGGGKNQLIAKAVGLKNKKNITIIDATAGFGVDAFILSSLGCTVIMLERSPIISALLADGLERLNNKNLKISLKTVQSVDYIAKIIKNNWGNPDVIYLDPMYPKRSKSALNKKTMRILHEIVGDDSDATKLLEPAIKCAKNRVVVKRPSLADYLGGVKPDLQYFSNGSSRYDIYFSQNSV